MKMTRHFLMIRENELHGWLEEALIAIERFQEASNLFLNC